MAEIGLIKIRHSYEAQVGANAEYALKNIDLTWKNGGAYALLGPSGCGKTTLLNIVSGLLKPTEGRVLFDGKDVTQNPPDERNIAQVFQFPVVYDTMSVYDNLVFPLKNRNMDQSEIKIVAKRAAKPIASRFQIVSKRKIVLAFVPNKNYILACRPLIQPLG